jgi:hypothetical protein
MTLEPIQWVDEKGWIDGLMWTRRNVDDALFGNVVSCGGGKIISTAGYIPATSVNNVSVWSPDGRLGIFEAQL